MKKFRIYPSPYNDEKFIIKRNFLFWWYTLTTTVIEPSLFGDEPDEKPLEFDSIKEAESYIEFKYLPVTISKDIKLRKYVKSITILNEYE